MAALPPELESESLWYPADTYMTYGELAGTLRGAIPVDEPFVLVAESYATVLALWIAALEPPNLKGIVLSAGFATSPLRGWKRTLAWDLAPVFSHLPLPAFAVRYLMVGDGAPKPLVESVKGAFSWLTPKVVSGRVREMLNADARAELALVKVPILYLQPTRDRLVDPGCLGDMRAVREGRVASVDAPHLALQSEPVVCAEILVEFVKGLVEGRQ
ncbi:MAG: hypothetical protein WBY53_01625 [Acidobacteriaceae bacterium]